MPTIQRSVGGSGEANKPAAQQAAAAPSAGLSLPSTKSAPREDLGDYTWLIYGEKKIGKTSIAARFPDTLFMMFEPGGKGLSIYQRPVTSWDEFKEYIRLLRGTNDFRTVVIDTVDIAYEKCMTYVGKRNGFTHPSEKNDFGVSWGLVSKEFSETIHSLINTGRGVMFISHAKESEFQEAGGAKYNKINPSMSGQVRNFTTGFVDIIAYYGYHGNDRRLTLQGSDKVDAGHRIEGRFLVHTEEGDVPLHSIDMGGSADEGYANILRAFNNEQTDPLRPDREVYLSTTQAKRGTGGKR